MLTSCPGNRERYTRDMIQQPARGARLFIHIQARDRVSSWTVSRQKYPSALDPTSMGSYHR